MGNAQNQPKQRSTAPTQTTTQNAPNTPSSRKLASKKQAPIDPASVPWFDESYSFADRDRELSLMDNLLTMQLSRVRAERSFLHQQIRTQDFGLPFASEPHSSNSSISSDKE